MKIVPFKASRPDGRSDIRVLLDLVKDQPAGTAYSFDELREALQVGTGRKFAEPAIRNAVSRSFRKMLKEQQRTLHSLKGYGYRLAFAQDHMRLAEERKHRANVQMGRGLLTLQQVRWDEMDAATRAAHEGTLMIVSALIEQQRALERRMSRIETAIRNTLGKPAEPPDGPKG